MEDRCVLSGLTLIVHGHEENVVGWVDRMANEIRARVPNVPTAPADAQTAEYTLKMLGSTPASIYGYDFSRSPRDSAYDTSDTATGETVIKVDWSQQAVVYQSNMWVGDWVTGFLLEPANQHLLSGPIHLIGFSRGAAVITDIARNLAQRNIWVDQFTLLDPHPVDYDLFAIRDHSVRIHDNVRFADNYWHSYLGRYVPNAHNVAFPYYHFTGGHYYSHWDIPLWYIGTMDTEGSFTDGTHTIPPETTWYASPFGPRDQVGYSFSRIGGGDRTRAPGGLPDASTRVFVPRTGSQWANLDAVLGYTGGSVVCRGDVLDLSYRYQAVSAATVNFGFDDDTNPLNGVFPVDGVVKPATSAGGQFDPGAAANHRLDTSPMEPGRYYIYAQITSADGHVRYVYGSDAITVLDRPPDRPTAVSPANGSVGVAIAPLLNGSPFRLVEDASVSHQASQWILAADPYGTEIVWNQVYDADEDRTAAAVDPWSLEYDTTYFWAVRYLGSHGIWSPWSETSSFHTRPAGPLTTRLARAADQPDPTNRDSLVFQVTFSEPVSDFSAEHVALFGTAPGDLTASVTGSGTRYEVAVGGMTGSGTVGVRIPEGAVRTAAGTVNDRSDAGGARVVYDNERPQASLVDPVDGASVPRSDLNRRKYLDLVFSDLGGAGLDSATVLDAEPEFRLLGTAAAHVAVNGVPQVIGPSTYRYTFEGDFTGGVVLLEILPGAFADKPGNQNVSATPSFTVLPQPQIVRDGLPYSQDFSSGQPGEAQGWEYASTNEGRIRVVDGRLRADDRLGNLVYSLNEAILHVDLADQSNVQLSLNYRSLNDEFHALPKAFWGRALGDGIAISADGLQWYAIDQPAANRRLVVDLDAAIAAAGIRYSSDFRIKFQQYDNYPAPTDGCEWDDLQVEILRPPTAQPVRAGQPYVQDFSGGLPSRAEGWEHASTNEGRIRVVDGRLRADDLVGNGVYSRNESTLHLNLAGQSQVRLTLDHWSRNDESHPLPGVFVGRRDGDGIAISSDGVQWYTVVQVYGTGPVVVDLDAAVAAAGIQYSADFQIKFQQYDNYPAPHDGREWDNLRVETLALTSPPTTMPLLARCEWDNPCTEIFAPSPPAANFAAAGEAPARDDHRDVNRDGDVTPMDVLILINAINRYGVEPLAPQIIDWECLDVNRDGILSPKDVLEVIEFLNRLAD